MTLCLFTCFHSGVHIGVMARYRQDIWMLKQVKQVVAIIDIDCAELNGFTTQDQEALEELAQLLAESCDF